MHKTGSLKRSLAVLAVLCCLATPPAKAETADASVLPDHLVMKEFSFDRETILYAFLSTVFGYPKQTPYSFLPSAPWGLEERYGALSTVQGYKDRYPWLYEYVYREKGMPAYWGLNKWAKPITISLGFPFGLKPAAGTPDDNAIIFEETVVEPTDEARKIAEEEIKAAMPFLSENTGLNISYLPPEKETEENIASLRIVFSKPDQHEWESKYRRGEGDPFSMTLVRMERLPKPTRFRKDIEQRYLHTAIHFTPKQKHHVGGFYLPEADNSIGMAFCFVVQDHPPAMLKSMIRECLVRAMGLPESVTNWHNTLLGPWNEVDKDNRIFAQPFSEDYPPYDPLAEFHKALEVEQPKFVRDPRKDAVKPPVAYSDFEKTMLRALYHPSVRRGMSRQDLMRLLALPTE